MNIEFKVNYTKKTFFRFYAFMLYGVNVGYLIINLIFPFVGLLVLVSNPNLYLFSIILILLPIALFYSMMLQTYSNFSKNKIYQYPETFTLNNETIKVTSEINQMVIKVEDLNKIFIAKNLVVIAIGRGQGYILTKESVENKSLEEIKVAIVKLIPKNKIKFYPSYPF